MTNPLAGHTAAVGFGRDAQGLKDGDGLTSPSLTNLYEGIHGNGIIRLEGGATGDALRNSIISATPGFVEQGASGTSYVKVSGGFCKLDGSLYKFAGGNGSTVEFRIGTDTNYSGTLPSPPSVVSDVFVVVYLAGALNGTHKHVMYEVGTPVSPTAGTPLVPNVFLSKPSALGVDSTNHQTTVLAIIRYTLAAGQANLTAAFTASGIVHDRRTFLDSNSPMYLAPMTTGATLSVGDNENVDSASVLDSRHTDPEDGDFSGSDFGAIWQTHTEGDYVGHSASDNNHAVLLYAAPRKLDGTTVHDTHRLGPNKVVALTHSPSSVSFTFDQGNIFLVNTASGAVTLTPSGSFPHGHIVRVRNYSPSGSNAVTFDDAKPNATASSANQTVAVGKYSEFIYDGTNWFVLFAQA